MTPERALWAAVLDAAILDARNGRDPAYIDTPDFAMVAALAGLAPDAAREAIRARAGSNAGQSRAA